MSYPAPALLDDEGEAFARAVFRRFLRQATICQDIDDAIEHMHIVNDDSRTFDIRLGGEARIPVGRELILALAAKKKELLALCESALRAPRVRLMMLAYSGTGRISARSLSDELLCAVSERTRKGGFTPHFGLLILCSSFFALCVHK